MIVHAILKSRELVRSQVVGLVRQEFKGFKPFHSSSVDMAKALVLGVYQPSSDSAVDTTAVLPSEAASHFDKLIGGGLRSLIEAYGPNKKGRSKTFYGLHADYPVVSVVGLGPLTAGYNEAEQIDERRENVRSSIAIGVKAVRDELNIDEVHVDGCENPDAAAEGAHLALWHFDELKSDKYKKKKVKIDLYDIGNEEIRDSFDKGAILAGAQNLCRRLAEMPANLMTPTLFCKTVERLFEELPSVSVVIHDKHWAESKKMNSFLSVAKGSAEPPKFLELHYNGKTKSKPLVMVGKGICFDSGGISIKSASNMDKMRYDMGGAANVVATICALASLDAQVNVIGLAPLCENLPSGTANKPGDVVVAMNGKTIQIDNTDAEGRLILADGLCYAHEFEPLAILDIATLTGAIKVALGSSACGAFTNSTELFEKLQDAGSYTGDRVWRMPLFSHYKSQVTNSQLADCSNVGKHIRMGGACTAAAFLSEFVTSPAWIHLDIAGVMQGMDDINYYGKNMTGRPVRTLYYFIEKFFE